MPELRYRNRGSDGASVKHSLGSRPATSTRLLPSPRPPRTTAAAVSSVDRCFKSRLGRRLGELRSEDALDYSATTGYSHTLVRTSYQGREANDTRGNWSWYLCLPHRHRVVDLASRLILL